MTTIAIDGRALAARIREQLKARLAQLKTQPGLAIVQIGENPESTLYVKLKERASAELGIHFEKHLLPETTSQEAVLHTIAQLNGREDIHGIIVQLPLPDQFSTDTILRAVAREKDVDGLHPDFQGAIQRGVRTRWLPALQQSILALLEEAGTSLRGKTVLILAKSLEFRSTLGQILRQRGCRIEEAAAKEAATQTLPRADIVITALGEPRVLSEPLLKPGATLIDVGLTKLADGSVAGDFAGPDEPSRLAAFSPVPGGIGPVTVASLLQNTITACEGTTRRSLLSLRIDPTVLMWAIPGIAFSVSAFFFGGAHFWGRALLFLSLPLTSLLWWMVRPRALHRAWWKNPDLFFAGFLLVAAISTALSPIPKKSIEEFSLLLLAGLAFVLGRAIPQTDRRRFLMLLVAGAVVLCVWSIWTFLTQSDGYPRIYGPFKNPDGLGAALLLPLLFSAGLFRTFVKRWQKTIVGIALLVIAGTLAATSALSSFVGLTLALMTALFFFRGNRRRTILGIVVLLFIAGGLAALTRGLTVNDTNISVITGFTRGGASGSFSQRVSFVQSSLAMFADAPIIGVGLGTWSDFFPAYQRSRLERTELAHGALPQYLAEVGSVGFLLFLALLAALVFSLLHAHKRQPDDPLTPYAIVGLIALAVAGCIDVAWFYPVLVLSFWFCAGLFLSPLSVELQTRAQISGFRIGVTLFTVALLGYGLLRLVTAYYADAAMTSASRADGYFDALATADLTMQLFPTPSEELNMSIVLLTKSMVPAYSEQLNEWVQRTIDDNPRQPASYLLFGRLKRGREKVQEAEQLYREGLRMDPYFVPDLAVDLSDLFQAQGRYEEARDLAAAQIERTGLNVPERERSLSTLAVTKARAELALQDREAAHASLTQALEFSPDNQDARALLKETFNEE